MNILQFMIFLKKLNLLNIYPYIYVQQIKKRKHPFNFNANYLQIIIPEMKLVAIIMDYFLHIFEALKFFLKVRGHGGFQPNFNFSM